MTQPANSVFCAKLQVEAEALARAPYPGALGQRILANISQAAWGKWKERQTMLINEYRLNLTEDSARKFLEEQMEAFLFGNGGEAPVGYIPPENNALNK